MPARFNIIGYDLGLVVKSGLTTKFKNIKFGIALRSKLFNIFFIYF
jgi:hypothetical protein